MSSLSESLDYVDEKSFTAAESIRTKSMYGGSLECILKRELFFTGSFKIQEVNYSPTFYNCLSEPLINMYDQSTRVVDAPKEDGGKVKSIKATFNMGHLTCFNNGVGMPVKERTHIDGEKYWNMFLNCTQTMTGANQKEDNSDKIVGGDNGLGLKLGCYSSNEFIGRSGDLRRGKFFEQEYTCEIKTIKDPLNINEPVLMDLVDAPQRFRKGGTEFSMKLDTKHLGYKEFTKSDNKKACAYIKAMLILLTTHTADTSYLINTYFNGEIIDITTIPEVIKLFGFNDFITERQMITYNIKMKKENKTVKYPFNLYIAFNPIGQTNDFNLSIINNVISMGKNKSTHIEYIKKYINTRLKVKLTAFCKKRKLGGYDMRKIFNNVTMFISGKIPGISYDSQKKTTIEFKEETFVDFKLSDEFINNLLTNIQKLLLIKHQRATVKELGTFSTARTKDYKPASKLNTDTIYIIGEGEHALETLIKIKDSIDVPCSTFHSKGVPINSLKETKYEINLQGQKVLQLSPKFKKTNKQGNIDNRMLQMMNHLGLKFQHKYELNEKGNKEFSLLKAGYIVIGTDQDVDGIGFIATLIMLFIWRFWPCLLDRGFVKIYESPLMRVRKKKNFKTDTELLKILDKKILPYNEFYSEIGFEKWVSNLVTDLHIDDVKDSLIKICDISYYKGLGSHEDKDIVDMAKTFHKHLNTMIRDKNTDKFFNVMCGPDADLRKNELIKKRIKEDPVWKKETINGIKCKSVSISHHIKNETRWFHLLKITRALPSYISGLTVSRTKILFQMMKVFRNKNSPKAVSNMAGNIKEKMEYHHGEKSLEGTIILMAQSFKGANNIPFIKDNGQFGSILKGTNSNIQPRYVSVSLRSDITNIVYPPDRMKLLDYTYEDGKKVEPKFLCPIIPMAVLENRSVPGSGWKVSTWGRDIKLVFECVRMLIKGKSISNIDMWGKLNLKNGRKSTSSGKSMEEDVAEYTYDKHSKSMTITELPLGVYLEKFEINMDKYPDVKVVSEKKKNITDLNLKLIFKDHPVLDRPTLKKYMLLCDLDSHLNFMDPDFNVSMFKTYNEVIEAWFPNIQKNIEETIERNIKVKEIKIIELENILRYLKMEPELNITKKTLKIEIDKIFEKNNFVKLDLNISEVRDVKKFALELGNINFKYLHNVKFIKKSNEGYNKYLVQLTNAKNQLEGLKLQTWQKVWLDGLDKLELLLK